MYNNKHVILVQIIVKLVKIKLHFVYHVKLIIIYIITHVYHYVKMVHIQMILNV